MTLDLINVSARGETAIQKIQALNEQVDVRQNHRLEVAIRSWALQDPLALQYQKRVDHERREWCQKLFTELTGSESQGALLGTLAFAFFVGAQQMLPPLDQQEHRDVQEYVMRLVTAQNREESANAEKEKDHEDP